MTEPQSGTKATVASDPHDRKAMLKEVLEGLGRTPKELSPKYFYDAVGSELFERITELDEYYPTRAEKAVLDRCVSAWVERDRPAALVELGAGSAAKSRVILDAMEGHGTGDLYVPVDVSGEFLHDTAEQLRQEYEELRVAPAVADITKALDLPVQLPTPTWYALLGGTIGNFPDGRAIELLRRVSGRMHPEDRFLIGMDLRPGPKKTRERLEAAYNDRKGVTAAFNLNILRVLNRELGSDFDLDAFRHHAFYNEEEGRIEMHLVTAEPHSVRFPGGDTISLRAGESIRTEVSCKYDRPSAAALLDAAGLSIDSWEVAGGELFALVLARAR